MTTVFPISSALPPKGTGPADPTTDTTANNQLNENTFLTLLVAQLKYQDPMNPADSTQFLTQTAQFTEVETLQKMEAEQSASQAASQVLAASTMIGRPVTYSLAATGGSGTPTPTTTVTMQGTLSGDAPAGATATASTTVFTSTGAKVPLDLDFTRTADGWTVQAATNGTNLGDPVAITFDPGGHPASDVTIPASALDGAVGTTGDWPAAGITLGFGAAGGGSRVQLASGATTVSVAEQNGNDGESATGVVTGVHLTSSGPQLVIDGQDVAYSAVTDVQS